MNRTDKFLDIARAIVRPFVTLVGWAALTYLVVTQKITAGEYLALYGPILGFWFGTRGSIKPTP